MLNTIIKNELEQDISKVSGIPNNWTRSKYNSITYIKETMQELVDLCITKSKYVILSYNNEGLINMSEWKEILKNYNYKKYELLYDTYKGSRNLNRRSNKVLEIMYLIYK